MSLHDIDNPRPVAAVPMSIGAMPVHPAVRVESTMLGGEGAPKAPALPPAPSAVPDLMGLLKALRRRWAPALVGGLICAVFMGTAAFFLVPSSKYSARSRLFVSSERPREIFDTRESVSAFKTYQQTQIMLITSRPVLSAALDHPDVAQLAAVRKQVDTIDWLSQQIKVDFPNGSEILQISMADEDPQAAMMLVNTVTDAYLEKVVQHEQNGRLARFERLKALFNGYQEDLRKQREDYRKKAESVGPNDKQSVATQHQLASQYLASLRQELVQVQSDLRKAEVKLRVLEAKQRAPIDSATSPIPISEMIEKDAQIAQYRGRLGQLMTQRTDAKRLVRNPSDPSLRRIEQEIATVQRALEDRYRRLRPLVEAQVREATQTGQETELDEVRENCQILREQEQLLKEQIAAVDGQMKSLNVQSIDLHWQEDEIELASAATKTVGTELQAMKVEFQAPSRIRWIEHAEMPSLSDPKRKIKVCGMAALCGFALVVGGVSFREFQARRIDTVDEVTRGLGLSVMGALPDMTQSRRGVVPDVRQRLLVESIDAIRTMLLHTSRAEAIRTVMVTSALKGEGKTSLSCHLAASLARAHRRTLLIDCDLRRPSVHRLLDRPPGPGMSELLRGEAALDDVIQPTPAGLLSLISAGRCDDRSIEALSHSDLGDLFAELGQRFDFVIVDSAPVLLVTDSLIVSQHVDAVLLSILRDVSRVPKVYAACERLAALGIRMLGAIVVGVREEQPNYGDYYAASSAGSDPMPGPSSA